MAPFKDLTGQVFGRLKVIERNGSKDNKAYWKCKCECGNITNAIGSSLIMGHTKSCGCLRYTKNRTHGLKNHPIYWVYRAMISRCTVITHKSYINYGGRGITVCEEWLNSVETFVKWSELNGYKKGLQLDREDNDKNYTPDNCRFVTRRVNLLNRRHLDKCNTTGYRGVSIGGKNKILKDGTIRYVARVANHKKQYHIGSYDTPLDAAIAYDQFIIDNNFDNPLNNVL